jgi:hypothetical protein
MSTFTPGFYFPASALEKQLPMQIKKKLQKFLALCHL